MEKFTTVSWIIAIIAIIVAIIVKKNMTKIIGFAGEFWVRGELNKLPDEYLFLSDVMLEVGGKTTQIDHIVFSKYGIFVIETKQMNTYITGNEHDKYWVIKAGKNKYYMYNPIHQNYGHKKAIEQILGLEDNQVIDVVCVSGQANLRIKSNKVVRVERLVDRILFEKQEKIRDYVKMAHIINDMNIVDKEYRKTGKGDLAPMACFLSLARKYPQHNFYVIASSDLYMSAKDKVTREQKTGEWKTK